MIKQSGQTLLEILLAFGVSIIVLSAIILGITTSLSNVQYSKNQGLATFFAQEEMAAIRQIRDSSWAGFSAVSNGSHCFSQNLGIVDYDGNNCANSGTVGIFVRRLEIAQSSSDCSSGSKVTVTVSWADGKCPTGTGNPFCHSVILISCFSNIDQKSNP